MIKVTIEDDFNKGRKVITALVPYADLTSIKLDPFDRAVLGTPEKSAADVFQSLEILTRRQAEQVGSQEKEGSDG